MQNRKVNIALYGILGVYNYGCEAIVRGCVKTIKEVYPDANITLVTPRVESDSNQLGDLGINFIERKAVFYKKIINKITQKIGMGSVLYREDLSWLDEFDMVFSIGGDLYTLPGQYQQPKGVYYNQLIHFGDIVKKKGKKLIIYGASIGPFDGYEKVKSKFLHHFKDVDLIVVREKETFKYLYENMIQENLILAPDPAFSLHSKSIKKHNELLNIGINLSPLSVLDTQGCQEFEEIKKQHIKTIMDIYNTYRSKIVLIPHVISDDIGDDDYRYLKTIQKELTKEIGNDIIILNNDLGFLGTKDKLKELDIVIAARMHCAINALESNIPTIFLSYSKKSIGMAEYVYGNKNNVLPLSEFATENFKYKLSLFINEKETIQEQLVKRNLEINNEVEEFINIFKQRL